jgi:tetratricopeptide (TPR) repeat protein
MQYGGVLRALEAVESAQKGLEHFRRAVALEPKSATAHAELAYSCISLAETEGLARPELLKEAFDEAQEAIRLDPNIAEAYYNLSKEY